MTHTDSPIEAWLHSAAVFSKRMAQLPPSWAEEESLDTFVSLAHQGTQSDVTAFFSSAPDGTWLCEMEKRGKSGKDVMSLGKPFEAAEDVDEAVRHGETVSSDGTLYVPVFSGGQTAGCMVFKRPPSAPSYSTEEVRRAETFVNVGALAIELVGAREAHNLASVLAERERISRDLHDLGIQDLFAVGIGLQSLQADLRSGLSATDGAERLEEALVGLEGAIAQVRQVVRGLKDPVGPSSFAESLHFEASKARGHLGFAPAVTLEVDGHPVTDATGTDPEVEKWVDERIHPGLAGDIIAVLREALMNIAKHAGAQSAQVNISIHGAGPTGELEMVILDDGAGVDPSVSRSSGLSNMAGRARNHGGSFGVSAGPRGRGTSLVWRAPLE